MASARELTFSWEEERGAILYEAFRRACAGISVESGDPLPDFRALDSEVRSVWIATADDVWQRLAFI